MMRHRAAVASVLTCAGFVAPARAQEYPLETELRFEVYDGEKWTQTMRANPCQQVEWRVVVTYIGNDPRIYALGEILYQPIISNADNSGSGSEQDQVVDLIRNSGFGVPGSLLAQPDGHNPHPRATSETQTDNIGYGRVNFGQSGMTWVTTGLSTFRHSAGSDGAPAGEWIRLAGGYVSQWPVFPMDTPSLVTADALNRILRGVSANQLSHALLVSQGQASDHTAGSRAVVVFRGALILSCDALAREVSINSDRAFLNRVGRRHLVVNPDGSYYWIGDPDDRRYATWQTSISDHGTYRTSVRFVPARIFINTDDANDTLDFDNDGVSASTEDLFGFITGFAGLPCPTHHCNDPDFNNDLVYPDATDLLDFVAAFANARAADGP